MTFAGLSHWSVLAAAVAGFIFGGVYYGMLSNAWLSALGKSREEVQQTGMAVPLLVTVVALLVMAWMLAGIMGHLGQINPKGGLITGFLCWLGFVATTIATNHAYQGAKLSLTLIDSGYWLGVLLIEGAVIGSF